MVYLKSVFFWLGFLAIGLFPHLSHAQDRPNTVENPGSGQQQPGILLDAQHIRIQRSGSDFTLLDSKGNSLFPYAFEYALQDANTKGFLVRKDGKFGFVNAEGKLSIPCDYTKLTAFDSQQLFACSSEHQCGLIDLQNKQQIPFEYTSIQMIPGSELLIAQKSKSFGLINKQNEIQVPIAYRQLKWERDDLFSAFDDLYWGLINSRQDTLLDFVYQSIQLDSYGNYIVSTNHQYGVINSEDEQIISNSYDRIQTLQHGYFLIGKDGKKGVYDKIGHVVIPIRFEGISFMPWVNRIAAKQNGKWGLLNMAGGEITTFQYEDINSVGKTSTLFTVLSNGKYGIIDDQGAVRLEPEFNMLYVQTGSGYFQIQQNGLLGIADTDGSLLVPAIYYELDLSGFSLSKLDKKEFIFPPIPDIIAVGRKARGGNYFVIDPKGKAYELVPK